MVGRISKDLKEAISKAITEAEKRTTAEIMLVMTPASDAYESHVILYGLTLGSIAAGALWATKTVTAFPLLLGVQVAAVLLAISLPALRALCVKMVPLRTRRRMAARRALEEFVFACRHFSHDTPVVLLYVSLAERYAHVLRNRPVPHKVPEETWSAVIEDFTGRMKQGAPRDACLAAIARMADVLEKHFPEKA